MRLAFLVDFVQYCTSPEIVHESWPVFNLYFSGAAAAPPDDAFSYHFDTLKLVVAVFQNQRDGLTENKKRRKEVQDSLARILEACVTGFGTAFSTFRNEVKAASKTPVMDSDTVHPAKASIISVIYLAFVSLQIADYLCGSVLGISPNRCSSIFENC